MGLCSGALKSDIGPILKNLGLQELFKVIITAEDVTKSKPDPSGYRLAVRELAETVRAEFTANQCLAIEDTPTGINAARSAGLKVLAITNSYPAERLSAAHMIVDSLEEITSLHHLGLMKNI